MIGSINKEIDIYVFLEQDEIKKLKINKLEGTLIKTDKPKQQGDVLVSIDEKRKNESNGQGIGITEEGRSYNTVGTFELFIGEEKYEELVEDGLIFSRYNTTGKKIWVLDRSRPKRWENVADELWPKKLEFYIKNRDKLPDRKSTRLNSSHIPLSRMPSSA